MGIELRRYPDVGESVALANGKTATVDHLAMGIVTLSSGREEINVKEDRVVQDSLTGTWKLVKQAINE